MKYIIFTIICIAMLLVTACGDTKDQTSQLTKDTGAVSLHGSEALTNKPVQTTDHVLTILARNNYEAPIRQAEKALLAEWAQRSDKEGHTLTIELTTFHPDDEINQLTRLDTMLMAGQSYDMFFPVADHRHIREYVLSGFVTDIYPLIDNCPITNPSDFFTTALEAWEVDGGLYIFPWDFSFNYAFINSALPQPLRDRFAAHSTITVQALVEIYSELLRYHSADFGHYNFSHGSTLYHPSRVMVSYMSNFINFNDQTVMLTDDDFLAFLSDFTDVFDARHLQGQDREYWRNHTWIYGQSMTRFIPHLNPHSIRMIALGSSAFHWGTGWQAQWRWEEMYTVTMQPNAFLVESRDWFPAAAIMHENPQAPYFDRGIPLADEQGRLLIGEHSSYPAGVAISSAANGAVAWDFARHLINAFNKREMLGFESLYYPHSIAIPIVRDLFDFRMRSTLTDCFEGYYAWLAFPTRGPMMPDEFLAWRDGIIDDLLLPLYALAEMPMTLTHPPIPDFLYADNLELLLRGIIAPQDFAQRTQNAVSLWLIGG